MSRHEKKLKDKLDDEIKFVGLETLVLEELENHLILYSHSTRIACELSRMRAWRSFCVWRQGLVEELVIPSRVTRVRHLDPMDVDAVNSLSPVWQSKKGHCVRVMGVLSAVEHIFNETAMHATQASNRLARANRASHCPRVRHRKE